MAFMNLIPKPNVPKYAGLQLAEGVEGFVAANKTSYCLKTPIVFTRKGDFVDNNTLSPNHTYRLVFGRMKVHPKFDVLLRVESDLCDKALISCPTSLHGGYDGPLSIIVRPMEAINLEELEHILSFSIFE